MSLFILFVPSIIMIILDLFFLITFLMGYNHLGKIDKHIQINYSDDVFMLRYPTYLLLHIPVFNYIWIFCCIMDYFIKIGTNICYKIHYENKMNKFIKNKENKIDGY